MQDQSRRALKAIRIRKSQGRFAYNPALPPKEPFETITA
ncbi:protein of unknown function [Nitratireductor aquimarinus]